MEYLGGGSLHHYLKKKPNRRLEDARARRIFVQVCQGLKYLHDRYIVHRDIKLENLLLDETGTVKLIDFGFSTVVPPGKKIKVFCGTPSYMAPEIVARKEYPGPCADIWAAGVLLYALHCGCFPFKGSNDRDLYRKIIKGVFFIPDIPVTAGVRGLLNKLLTVDMYRRPTITDVLADTWVQSGGPEDFKPVTKHQTSTSSATTATSSNARSSGLIPDDQQWTEREQREGKGAWVPPDADDVEEAPVELKAGIEPAEDQIKPGFAVEEEAIAKLERLGYAREEIIRQLQEEGSHLYKLYFRFLKALNAWGTK
jgi:serine/threonine protein kinase